MNSHGSKMEELKKRILITFGILIIYRISAQVPVPGVDAISLRSYFDSVGGSFFDLVNTFSGGSFKRFSVLALGIMPYITTSIIFSLLGEVIPQLGELQEDTEGIKKISRWTRYASVILSFIQGYGMAAVFETFRTQSGALVVTEPGLAFKLTTALTLATGTIFLLWLGERITEYGLENGVSLIIFAGIAVELPSDVMQKITLFRNGEMSLFSLGLIFFVFALFLYIVSYVEKAFRPIPVHYAKKVVNNRVYGGSQNLPIRVDTGGVMPPILASSLLAAPSTLLSFAGNESTSGYLKYIKYLQESLYPGTIFFNIVFSALIIYMAYFYAPIQFKTRKIGESLQKNNAFVPGVRPGDATVDYLDTILNRITFFGAIFLVVVCISPMLLSRQIGFSSNMSGTSLLIMVSVCIRLLINLQSFMFSDGYENIYKAKGKYSGAKRRF
jgi:preprotein translocase subunit SecY